MRVIAIIYAVQAGIGIMVGVGYAVWRLVGP
jgi:hypothetical protein